MKTSVVPAQVTTVEDKIAGNLSLTQLLLLAAPIFLSSVIYILIPPFIHLTIAKLCLCLLVFVVSAAMAIRVQGKILLTWTILVARYRIRPRYYVFNKNDGYLRSSVSRMHLPKRAEDHTVDVKREIKPLLRMATAELVRLETVIADPRANFNFRSNRRGGLDVHITEVK